MSSARTSIVSTPILALSALAATALLSACGSGGSSSDAGSDAGSSMQVEAGDRSCELDRSDVAAGTATFAITNTGDQTTEVYVYAPGDDGDYTTVVTEVENIGPGISRTMEAQLAPGTYEVACKPGQSGEGIRTPLTVQDDGAGDESAPESEVAYDREVELTTDGTSLDARDGVDLAATAGEKIEFKLENAASGPVTLELKNPEGDVAGEVEAIETDATGELIAALDETGQWQLIIERDGHDDIVEPLSVS